MRGKASISVDGSFISKSDVPLISPEESFDCPFGCVYFTYTNSKLSLSAQSSVDPSIRVIYHLRSKKVSQGGFFTTTSYALSQRITVSNTKTLPVENLTIIDQVPVSEDSDITEIGEPRIACTWNRFSISNGEVKAVKVGSGIVAQWHEADEVGVEVETLGKDGKLN